MVLMAVMMVLLFLNAVAAAGAARGRRHA
jgi:hypothetical protein